MLSDEFYSADVGMSSIPQIYFDFVSVIMLPISIGVAGMK